MVYTQFIETILNGVECELLNVSSRWHGSDETEMKNYSNCKFYFKYCDDLDIYELWGFSPDYDPCAPFYYKHWENIESIDVNEFPPIY